jgi:hypothetical protein
MGLDVLQHCRSACVFAQFKLALSQAGVLVQLVSGRSLEG